MGLLLTKTFGFFSEKGGLRFPPEKPGKGV
jgi:hypothetical protein